MSVRAGDAAGAPKAAPKLGDPSFDLAGVPLS